jgi:lycopene cyclase domain-containing protein
MNLNHLEYLTVLILCLSFPLLFTLFYPGFRPFRNKLLTSFKTIFLVSLPWLAWDILATFRAHWGFNSDYILGSKILLLPLEEIAFFWVIPFCCLFVWEILEYLKFKFN